jgi:Listeria-Bacteroides repeat domain (List_Bact_rpt).
VKEGYYFEGWSFGGSVYKAGFVFDTLQNVPSMVFVAVWSEYPTLSFNLNGGNKEAKFNTIMLGPLDVHKLEAPVRPGYKFVKWLDSALNKPYNAGGDISITRNTTLTAVWEGNVVTITYYVDSSVFRNDTGRVGSQYAVLLDVPVREGHFFVGWSSIESILQPGFVFEHLPNASGVVLTALWSEHPTLSFNLNGGNANAKFDTIKLGPSDTHVLEAPVRPGYKFIRWFDSALSKPYNAGEEISITNSTTLIAIWEGNVVTITYYVDSSIFEGDLGRVGSQHVIISDVPEKEGHFFVGWSYAGSVFQPEFVYKHLPNVSVMAFIALWSEHPTLSFNLNGGDADAKFDTVILAPGVAHKLAEPSRSGYRLVAWLDNATGSTYAVGYELYITGNTTLTAVWEGNYVSIRYDLNEGSGDGFKEVQKKVGSPFILTGNIPVRDGYHFIGWSYAGSVLPPGHAFEQLPNVSVMEFVAVWSEYPTLSFNMNGGESSSQFDTIYLGPGVGYTLAEPVRPGYKFVRWADTASDSVYTAGSEISIARNTTLKAEWEGNLVHIRHDLNGGSGVFGDTAGLVGSSYEITPDVPVRSGHHFLGWSYARSVFQPGHVFEQLPNASEMILIAVWSPNPMLVFNLNGGISSSEFDTVLLSPGVEHTLGKPSRTGYGFVEWRDKATGTTYQPGDKVSITRNTTLSAAWIGNDVVISYDLNGGSGTAFGSTKCKVGSVFKMPAEEPILEGYYFAGWSFRGSVYKAGSTFDPLPNFLSMRFVAVWSEHPTLSFDLQGGSGDDFDMINDEPGKDLILTSAEPARPGYSFGGWQNIRIGEIYWPGDTISITVNTVLTAIWNGNDVTISYRTDAGEAPSSDVYTFDGSSYVIARPTKTMVKPGHEFTLWKDGNGNIYRPGAAVHQFTSNTELTAVWAPVPDPESYTVMVTVLSGVSGGVIEYRIGNSDFVTYIGAVQVPVGEDITFRATADKKSSFKQWTYDGETITGDMITISGVTSSVSILAEFEQESNDYIWTVYLLLLLLPVAAVIWAYRSKGQ